MVKELAVPIPLKVWQDPQGDVVLHNSREECKIYFGCWIDEADPADYICKLTFVHCWAVRGFLLENFPYEYKEHLPSCIYEIENSDWLKKSTEQRSKLYPNWKEWDARI